MVVGVQEATRHQLWEKFCFIPTENNNQGYPLYSRRVVHVWDLLRDSQVCARIAPLFIYCISIYLAWLQPWANKKKETFSVTL